MDAQRALRFGLVNEVYEDKEKLLAGARALCQKIAENSPLAVQGAKHVLKWAEEHTFEDTLQFVGEYSHKKQVSPIQDFGTPHFWNQRI